MEWLKGSKKIIKILRDLYYRHGLISLNYCETTKYDYIAYINKNYVTWEKDLQYIKDYCRTQGIKLETFEDGNRIYLKFHQT